MNIKIIYKFCSDNDVGSLVWGVLEYVVWIDCVEFAHSFIGLYIFLSSHNVIISFEWFSCKNALSS